MKSPETIHPARSTVGGGGRCLRRGAGQTAGAARCWLEARGGWRARHRALGCALVLGLAALAAAPIRATETNQLSTVELKEARKLYVGKCAKCHAFYEPAVYTATGWNEWMDKMGKKSKLKAEQTELLKRYTATLRPGTNAAAHSK